ncbi:MAG: cytidine deaminase family protein [Roseiflexaceae bacterium]
MPTTIELIQHAAAQIATVQTAHGVVADVGCALESATGQCFFGVCVGFNAGSMCAERTAIATMITATRTYQIRRIVAVWRDADANLFVIPPCGHCRQFMIDAHPDNVHHTQVILSHDVVVPLASLMPYHDWWQKQPTWESV